MKKSLIILGVLFSATTLLAISFYNRPYTDMNAACKSAEDEVMEASDKFESILNEIFLRKQAYVFHGFAPRFTPLKKSDIDGLLSARFFLPEDALERLSAFKSTSLNIYKEGELINSGDVVKGELLNADQLKQLHSLDYSTNFMFDIFIEEKDPNTGDYLGVNHYRPHYSIVPDVQAEYKAGLGALYQYLRDECKSELENLDTDALAPGLLYVTIGADAEIQQIKLVRSSSYKELDNKVIEAFEALPGEWEAATDHNGNRVDQELVLFFGNMGC